MKFNNLSLLWVLNGPIPHSFFGERHQTIYNQLCHVDDDEKFDHQAIKVPVKIHVILYQLPGSLLERKLMAICSYVARKNSEPMLVALLPQVGNGATFHRSKGWKLWNTVRFRDDTVDGSEIRWTHQGEVGSLSHYLQGFINSQVVSRISSINSRDAYSHLACWAEKKLPKKHHLY